MLQKANGKVDDCYHCGLPVVAGYEFHVDIEGKQRSFCCPACQTIATTIVENGLASFYDYQQLPQVAANGEDLNESFAVYDDVEFQQRHFNFSVDENFNRCELLIGGMHCAACVWLLENYLSSLDGIERITVSYVDQKAVLQWQPERIRLSEICAAIARLGYQPEPYSLNQVAELRQRENHKALRRLGVAGIAMMQVGMFAIALYAGALQGISEEHRSFMRWVSMLVATPVVFYSAQPFFLGAWRGLKFRRPGMDLPVAIAIGLAYIASCIATMTASGEVYFDSVTMFTFLLLAGRYMEMKARHFSSRVNTDLMSLLPSTVTIISDQAATEQSPGVDTIPLFKLRQGDKILVKAGQIIPADCLVIQGRSHVNESQLTGEFIPLLKESGDQVVAGTLNGDGPLTLAVEATGGDLKLQSINELLNRAQSSKPTFAVLADRYASYFVLLVLLVAATSFMYWYWVDNGSHAQQAFWVTLSVLVVSCPCALSLATPTAITAATNRLRSLGLLVTASEVWEQLPEISDVVCDKTGTLTEGKLSISAIKPFEGYSEKLSIDLAAALEIYSEHPIASAFQQDAPTANKSKINQSANLASELIDADVDQQGRICDVKIDTGDGVQATIDGSVYRIGRSEYASKLFGDEVQSAPDSQHWVLLSNEAGPVCWFQLQDSMREDAALLVEACQQRQLTLHILSGDSSGSAQDLARKLGFDHCVAGASPKEKLAYIYRLQNEGRKVLMLGDGINDIPVLAAADISVAMVNASNLAKGQADCILLSEKLKSLVTLMDIARQTRKVVRQNISWALAYNLTLIPLAAMAMIPPYIAAIGMSLSSLFVVFNAMRLQSFKDMRVANNSLEREPGVSYG